MKLGNINIAKAFLGTTEIKKVMLGTTLVYDIVPIEEANGFDLTINYIVDGMFDTFYYKINEDTTYSQINRSSSITIPNVTQITFYYTSDGPADASYHRITGSYTISGGYHILNEPMIINFYTSTCFIEGTQISLGNGLTKNVEDITYDDELLVWNFDEGKFDTAKPLFILQGVAPLYKHVSLEKGYTLNTVNNHRLFNVEKGRFIYPKDMVGEITITQSGEHVKVLEVKEHRERVKYYNIITDYHLNCYANGLLTSLRLNNIYPILNMSFIKDNRELTSLDAFADIPTEYIEGLRLREQPDDINRDGSSVRGLSVRDYVLRLMRYRGKVR